jgi:phosphatidylinositol glycan class N
MFLIISSFFVHIAFLVSVFDIYFKSPIVHGIKPQSSPLEAPARRVVFMVADGLRADSFFEADDLFKGNASHLRYTSAEQIRCSVNCVKINKHNLSFLMT